MNLETHKIGRFDVRGEWTPELLPPLLELLEEYESYLPGWCEIAYVRFDTDLENATAACQLSFEYRHMILQIGAQFFDRDKRERASALVHEIMHAQQSVIHDVALSLLKSAIGDNELAMDYARKQLLDVVEGATCDLTALIMRVENNREG